MRGPDLFYVGHWKSLDNVFDHSVKDSWEQDGLAQVKVHSSGQVLLESQKKEERFVLWPEEGLYLKSIVKLNTFDIINAKNLLLGKEKTIENNEEKKE